jgi:hypothetical protein
MGGGLEGPGTAVGRASFVKPQLLVAKAEGEAFREPAGDGGAYRLIRPVARIIVDHRGPDEVVAFGTGARVAQTESKRMPASRFPTAAVA